jgi:hypothetical protein
MASRIRALRRTWPVLDSNEPNGSDWEIALWSEPLLAQASADLAKRLAARTALPVLVKDLLPLITGVVVMVDLAMRHWVSAESVWNGDTLAIAAHLWLRTYQWSYSGSGLRSNRLPALEGWGRC